MTSERVTTSQREESSELTVREVQLFSIVSCTNCPTTGNTDILVETQK